MSTDLQFFFEVLSSVGLCLPFYLIYNRFRARITARRNAVLQRLVHRRGGQIKQAHTYPRGRYPFRHGEVSIRLTRSTERETCFAELQFFFPERLPPMRILHRRGLLDEVWRYLREERIDIGDTVFEDAFVLEGDPEAIRSLLTPRVREHLWQLYEMGIEDQIQLLLRDTPQGAQILLRKQHWSAAPEELETFLAEGEALVDALLAAQRDTLRQVAERYDLRIERNGGVPSLSGVVDRMPVHVRFYSADCGWRTEIEVSTVGPPGLRITHKDRGDESAVLLNNPVLDMLIATSGGATAFQRLLQRDEALIEEVLAVVHGHPASIVTGEAVRLVADGGLWGAALLAAVGHAVGLARRLQGAAVRYPVAQTSS